jgi:regulator of sigma E protease
MDALTPLLDFLHMAISSLLVLGILIFVHELGHFLLAKMNGVGVLEFAIGFGRTVYSRRIGETKYSLRLIPLGGYVKMVQEDPGLSRSAETVQGVIEGGEGYDDDDRRLLENRDRWFYTKGFWAKSSIVIAGPAFNFLFAILLTFATISIYGHQVAVETPTVGELIPGNPAEKAGLKPGDVIHKVDGTEVTTWVEMAQRISQSGGRELTLEIERKIDGDPSRMHLVIAGELDNSELAVLEGRAHKNYKIGIVPEMRRVQAGLWERTQISVFHVYRLSDMTVRGLWGMLTAKISAKNIGGPIFIFQEAASNAKKGLERVFGFMIMLSVSLAVLNLLPVPILDGGHLVFFIIEAIKGGPLSVSVQERATQIGMALLLLLMVFAMSNDLGRLLGL